MGASVPLLLVHPAASSVVSLVVLVGREASGGSQGVAPAPVSATAAVAAAAVVTAAAAAAGYWCVSHTSRNCSSLSYIDFFAI